MKAVGGIQVVGGTHFVDRGALLDFLDAMIAADSVEAALAARLAGAEPAPRSKALRVSLPDDLRHAMLPICQATSRSRPAASRSPHPPPPAWSRP